MGENTNNINEKMEKMKKVIGFKNHRERILQIAYR